MAEDPRPPVAIRITRPYTTEDEFIEQELDTLSRTSVTLLGAQPRPQGVVLRFELVLSSGHVLMRGEGRVVGFKPNAHQGLGGLTLRFTRLDSRSKALVDKATAERERRRPSGSPPAGSSPPPPVAQMSPAPPPVQTAKAPQAGSVRPPPVAPTPLRSAPPPAPGKSVRPLAHVEAPSSLPAILEPLPLDLESTHAEAPTSKRTERESRPPLAPGASGRDALLGRLRKRADSMDAVAIQKILAHKKRHADS
ncbi:MAG TPA: hypothetical protein VIF09_15880 [Polyangiaceae bacterium]